ncbi:ATP-binding protein [Deinococcus maricopensis]|uniref:histidine kinase n=1 Tax=Deinococcus maricopensis (strain DSM 21211 / LMG 22137 / NRRL B-23946 / LB-34) TaxID=709986 RepID=E8U3T3_DEIML|nr:ATP-binding protein [Deinococcus maricopensis]ADV68776.1 multi-sensor signal transduction histidine kinase [Deinococcus maricopensis DSM 21211]
MTGGDDFLTPAHLGGPPVDTDNCAREPIHIPGAVQPHGALLVLRADDERAVQVSANSEAFVGVAPDALLGQHLADLVGDQGAAALRAAFAQAGPSAMTLTFRNGRTYDVTARRDGELLLMELEPPDVRAGTPALYHAIRDALGALEHAPDLHALLDVAAQRVRALTGLDRVMIYRFAADDSGEVVAEARAPHLHAFLGHRFPESDIPRQARALYVQHLLRFTADAGGGQVPLVPALNPVTNAPLQMGALVLRATSPVHLQYLRNMGVIASMSVSIVQDGRLWGLIACHHGAAHVVPQATRDACEFLGRVLSLQITAKRDAAVNARRAALGAQHARLVTAVTGTLTPLDALTRADLNLPGFLDTAGAAVRMDGGTRTLGVTPSDEDLEHLVAWLRAQGTPSVCTDALARTYPPGALFMERASGVLGVSISGNWDEYLLWFRPEIPATITWGGDPHKAVQVSDDGTARLTPRASFSSYVEAVRGVAQPWQAGDLDAALDLRGALLEVQGARLAALQDLNARLERANRELEGRNAELRRFAFVTAHDLQEPLRILTNFLELFSARYTDQLDGGADKLIGFAMGEAGRLRELIRDLYAYTEISAGGDEAVRDLALGDTLNAALRGLQAKVEATHAEVTHEPLPVVRGNPARLEQVLHHLLDNALKFSGPVPPRVHVRAERDGDMVRVQVRDEGLGIAPEYHAKIFEVFQRLNRLEAYSGNGVGLAIARRIVERHGGTLQVASQVGAGATFTFTVPAGSGA